MTDIWTLYATVKVKKIWGSFEAFLRYRVLNFEIFFLWGGVSITPNFLPRGSTNRQYFLSAGNLKRICIKHFLYIMALSVLVLELPGGRTFEFSAENFWPPSFAFLTNFRRIDFPIYLFLDAHLWDLSNFEIIFLIWRPVFLHKEDETFLGPHNISPNFGYRAPKFWGR